MSYHRHDLPLLSDLLRLLARYTNGKTGSLLIVCVCFSCSRLALEGVGLAVYLALLTRLRLVLARRKRLAIGVGWLVIMPG